MYDEYEDLEQRRKDTMRLFEFGANCIVGCAMVFIMLVVLVLSFIGAR